MADFQKEVKKVDEDVSAAANFLGVEKKDIFKAVLIAVGVVLVLIGGIIYKVFW